MGKTQNRVTGICLSLTSALLGAGTTALLYYAGQVALDLFYNNSTYMDDQHRINRRMPTDDWYGELILRGWTIGFIYTVPGVLGIMAFLFYNKCLLGLVGVFEVLFLIAGSFLHTCGIFGIFLYRYLVLGGTSKYHQWLGDCIYQLYNPSDTKEYDVDERCKTGRRLVLLGWILTLTTLIYNSCIFHSAGKKKTKKNSNPVELHASNEIRKEQTLHDPSGDRKRPRRRYKPLGEQEAPTFSRDFERMNDNEPGPSRGKGLQTRNLMPNLRNPGSVGPSPVLTHSTATHHQEEHLQERKVHFRHESEQGPIDNESTPDQIECLPQDNDGPYKETRDNSSQPLLNQPIGDDNPAMTGQINGAYNLDKTDELSTVGGVNTGDLELVTVVVEDEVVNNLGVV